jgi:hypothetical protein
VFWRRVGGWGCGRFRRGSVLSGREWTEWAQWAADGEGGAARRTGRELPPLQGLRRGGLVLTGGCIFSCDGTQGN